MNMICIEFLPVLHAEFLQRSHSVSRCLVVMVILLVMMIVMITVMMVVMVGMMMVIVVANEGLTCGPLVLSWTGGRGVCPSCAGTRPSSLSNIALQIITLIMMMTMMIIIMITMVIHDHSWWWDHLAAACFACFLLLPLPVDVRSPRITWIGWSWLLDYSHNYC